MGHECLKNGGFEKCIQVCQVYTNVTQNEFVFFSCIGRMSIEAHVHHPRQCAHLSV